MIELGDAQVFLTKVWGFQPERYPFLGFSEDGRRSSYLREARRGDWVIIVGTKQPPTIEEEQGRLLGLVQLGKDPLNSLEVLEEIGATFGEEETKDDGGYKWPYGLLFLKAYRFADKPDCNNIFGEYFQGLHWATNAVNLAGKFERSLVESVFEYALIETDIHEIPSLAKAQIYSQNVHGSKDGPTGPPPSGPKSGSERELGEGYTYALKLIGRPNGAYKIGSTSDLTERVATLNKELRPSVTGCSWELIWKHRFEEEKYAYNFEQLLHEHFKNDRFKGEKEIFKSNKSDIQAAWTKTLAEKRWIQD